MVLFSQYLCKTKDDSYCCAANQGKDGREDAALGQPSECCRGQPRSLLHWLNGSNPPHHCLVPWFALLGSCPRLGVGSRKVGRAGAVLGTAGGSGEAAGPAGQGRSQVQGTPRWCSITPPGQPQAPQLGCAKLPEQELALPLLTAAARCRMPWALVLTSPASSGVCSACHFQPPFLLYSNDLSSSVLQ